MSLLLDALKRAEQEKLAKQGERPANDAAAAPEAAPPKREPAKPASLELQPLGSAQAAGGAPAPAANARPAAAATAQAVFQAKSAPPKQEGARNLTMLWVIVGVVVVAAIGIGGYVWWSLSSLQPKTFTTVRSRIPATGPAVDAPTGRAKLDSLVAGANAPGAPPPTDVPMPPAAPTPPPASGAPLPTTASPAPANGAPNDAASSPLATSPSRAAPAKNPDLAAQLVRDAPGAPSLKLAPAEKPRVPTEIAAGYDALRSGDLPAARRSYTAALATNPASLDAYLGLATVEARLGNVAVAASHYRRALDLDPRNATALAGLASIADMSQPEQLEGQLRADIARYPQSAALQFALGNLYASRGRWEDAQAAFFEALRLEPASADALYNLAIAMDHMGQKRLAADYYRRAFEAARTRPAQFDPAQVARRLSELRP